MTDPRPSRPGCAPHGVAGGETTLVDLERRHERLLNEIDGLNERVEAALRSLTEGDAA